MKKFNELLKKDTGKTQPVVFAFGRLNPPTIGHEKLIERIITIAKRVKGLPVLYVSASQDKTKNPLTAKQKVDYLKKVYPRGIDIRTATGKERTFMEILKNRFDNKYTDVYMIAGSDRVAEFKKLIKKYNGTDYNFDTVNVVSAGERDADATGAKGMSASKMRGFASVNDFTSFKQGLISGTKEKDAMKLFKDLKKGMGVNEDMASEDENLRTIRENYHNNDLFNMGDIVENTKNGNVGKVIKRGPNYIQYEMEDGGVEKAWLDEVVPGNNIDEQIQVDEVDKKALVLQKNADQLKSFSSFEDEINEKRVAQDPDVKKSPGTQPKKYFSTLTKKDKKSRDTSFKRFGKKHHDDPDAYPKSGQHPGDDDAKTKPSKFTKKFDKMYGEEEVKEIADIKSWSESQETIDKWRDHYGADYRVHLDKTVSEMIDDVVSENTGVRNKAKKSGMPYGILMKVYNRGMAAWRGGHRPGASQQQWAMARVNSFVTKSSGTWGKADADLAAKVRGSK